MLRLKSTFYLLFFCISLFASSQTSDSLISLGSNALKTNLSKADSLFLKAIEFSQKENKFDNLLKSQKLRGYALYYAGSFSHAINSFQDGLSTAKQLDSTNYLFDLNNALGACYKYVGDLELAITHFNDAYEVAILLNDDDKIAKACNNLGVLFRLVGETENSITFLERALKVYKSKNDSSRIGETLNNIGLSYNSIEDYSKSVPYFKQALDFKSEKINPVSYAKTLNNLGFVSAKKGKLEEAKSYYIKAIEIAEKLNNTYSLCSFELNLVEILIEQNNIPQVRKKLNLLSTIIKQNNYKDLIPRLYIELSETAAKENNIAEAISYRDLHYAALDSMKSAETKNAIANAKLLKKIEEAEAEKLILKQENTIKELEITKKNWSIIIGAFILLSIILFGTILYLRFSKVSKLNNRLVYQEAQLIKEKNKAEKANAHKSEFLANMSHEIRTPLTGIKASLELLKDEVVEDSSKELLQILEGSTDSLLKIINDILDMSRIEAGKIAVAHERTSISKICKEVESSFKLLASKKEIDLNFEVPKNLPVVETDPTRLKQILYNLVGNAIKFTQQGRVTLKVFLNPNHQAEKFANFLFEVSDTGIGIEKERQQDIFEPFTQENSTTYKNFGGTGLGLTISKLLVELLGGELILKSESNKGSVFSFTLPLKKSENQAETKPASLGVKKEEKASSEKPQILLVEDNEINQSIFKMSIEKFGFKCDMAENGKIGLEMYEKNLYKLIFMDIRMPVMDGVICTGKIRQYEIKNNLKPTKIIAFTANAMIGDKEKYLESGMNDFLAKPFVPNQVKELIEKYT